MSKLAANLLVCALLGACGPRVSQQPDADPGAGDAPPQHFLIGIEVTPTNPILELDLNAPAIVPFTAFGRFLDGNDEDITDRVNWVIDNPAVGTLSGATLHVPGFPAVSAETARVKAVLDSVEGIAQITVVAYRRSGPAQDFFFILPYEDPAGLVAKPLDFGTTIPSLDVFFLMDTTGSMGEEIANLQNAVTGTIVPGVQTAVPNTQFGAGAFEDFPISPFGTAGCVRSGAAARNDQPFTLFQTITNSVALVQAGVAKYLTPNGVTIGCGNDGPESMIEALFQVATGAGLTGPAPTSVPPNTAGVGGVGFRAETMPVVVTITDAISHEPGGSGSCGGNINYSAAINALAHTRAQAKAALGDICARAVGVASDAAASCSGQADLEDFATATGAVVPPAAWDVPARPANCGAGLCCTGVNGAGRAPNAQGQCPLVFLTNSAGAGLGGNIVTGIQMLTRFATFDVTSDRQGGSGSEAGVPLPPPRTTADFIKEVTPTGFMLPPPPPVVPNPTFDAISFFGVTPGTRVQFDVRAHNDFVPQTTDAQIFRATIRVLAGGCTALDQRDVVILVPPNPIIVQ